MDAMLASFSSIIVIVLMMALGYVLRAKAWFSDSFSKDIANLITKIALPASVFTSVLKHLTRSKLLNLGINIIFPILTFVIGYAVAFTLLKVFKIKRGRRGIFVNLIVNANAVFIGMPLNNALFGGKAMGYYLLFYIINTISLWGIGVFLIQKDDPTQAMKGGNFNWKKLLPMPLLGFIVAVIWLIFEIPLPHFASQTLTYIGSLVTPLSLMYIGISLADSGLKNFHIERDTILTIVGKFIIFPAIMFVLLMLGKGMQMNIKHLMMQVFMVQAVMPSAAVIPILAKESHGDVAFATDVTVIGTFLFILVVPVVLVMI